jgi:hypothetical protein
MDEGTPIPTLSKPSTSFQRQKRLKTHIKQQKEETTKQRKATSTSKPSTRKQLRLPGTFKCRERPREGRRYCNGNG